MHILFSEQILEGRHDEREHDDNDSHAEDTKYHRIHHSRLYLVGELGIVVVLLFHLLHYHVKVTGCFTGLHHGNEEVGECSVLLLDGIREGCTLLYLLIHLTVDLLVCGLFLLTLHDVESLYKGKTRGHHRRHLTAVVSKLFGSELMNTFLIIAPCFTIVRAEKPFFVDLVKEVINIFRVHALVLDGIALNVGSCVDISLHSTDTSEYLSIKSYRHTYACIRILARTYAL